MSKSRKSEPAPIEAPSLDVETSDATTPEPSDAFVAVVYRGAHPLIRRCGVVLQRDVPKRVPRVLIAALTRSHGVEIASPD